MADQRKPQTTENTLAQIYVKNGDRYTMSTDDRLQTYHDLPPGNYNIKFDEKSGQYFFEEAKAFELPAKLYGATNSNAARVIQTYNERRQDSRATGLLLTGEKGGGKTLLAKQISMTLNLPTILVNEPFCDVDFKNIISNLGPSIIIFDEFEKVYHKDEWQNNTLTLLDGVYPSTCLFIVIVNDKYKLSNALINRPGRLHYCFEYDGLDLEFIKEYTADVLKNQDHSMSVLTVTSFFANFNFDMLQGLIEEMNRFGEPANVAVKFLNIKAEAFRVRENYDITASLNGKAVPVQKRSRKHRGNPLEITSIYIFLVTKPKAPAAVDDEGYEIEDDIDEDEEAYLTINQSDVASIDQETGTIVYSSGAYLVTFTKGQPRSWRLDGLHGPTRDF